MATLLLNTKNIWKTNQTQTGTLSTWKSCDEFRSLRFAINPKFERPNDGESLGQ
jgi:hypothetical protein